MLLKSTRFFAVLLLTCFYSYSAILTVSQDGTGQYSSIQSAVNASVNGDEIVILDNAIYNERVVITKDNLILRSGSKSPWESDKPTIRWQDKENVGPRNYGESLIDSLITYNHNGALFIYKSLNILISGLNIDGGGLFIFAYPSVWNVISPLFFGNCGVNILQSAGVVIRYCDIKNAFCGMYIRDENLGGVFADYNYDDNNKPISAFGESGNHIIELNKIHNNSYGLYFEADWDLGSTVRYNLIYENHHPDDKYELIKRLDGGMNEPGGAFIFKSNLISPLAIYNNTLWHNSLIFTGHWRAGHQHLIFNNIFAKPYKKWNIISDFPDWMDISPKMPNRIKNCLFAAQNADPENRKTIFNINMTDPLTGLEVSKSDTVSLINKVTIMDSMAKVDSEPLKISIAVKLTSGDSIVNVNHESIQPGGYITEPFTREDSNRWFEITFKSTDTLSPDFLVPDLNDSIVKRLVKNAGWKEAGVTNNDGTIADIGAPVPFINRTLVKNIVPLDPVYIIDSRLILHFNADLSDNSSPKLDLKYLRFIKNIAYEPNAFGASEELVIPQSNIVSVGSIPVHSGSNLVGVYVPGLSSAGNFGFVEMIIGSPSQTNSLQMIGFLPYRKMDPSLKVTLIDQKTLLPTLSVVKGEKVILKITCDSSITTVLDSAKIRLMSGEKIFGTNGQEFTITKKFLTTLTDTVIFNHTGDDVLVCDAYCTLDNKDTYTTGSSQLFNSNLSSNIPTRHLQKSNSQNNSQYALFSLSGKKIGTYSMDQLKKSVKGRQHIPSGMYYAVSESVVEKNRLKKTPFKVIVH